MRKDTADNQVWHENRVHHLLNKQRNNYDNLLVHTTKLYNIYRVNISAQFWILNELLNSIDIVFSEKGYSYDPISINSSLKEEFLPEDNEEIVRKSSLVDNCSFSKFSLGELISAQNFKGMSTRDKSLLKSKGASIKTFTGTPFEMKKSRRLLTRIELFLEGFKGQQVCRL